MTDLSPFNIVGANNPAYQYSATRFNSLLASIQTAIDVGSVSVTGLSTVTSRALLADLSTAGGAVFLREDGREGLFEWNATNLSAKITADPNQGLYVAPSSAPTGASGAWVRQFIGSALSTWFGVSTTATGAANAAAMNQALVTLKALAPTNIYASAGSAGLHTPAGNYTFGAAIDFNHPFEFSGEMSGPYGGGGTVFKFTDNTTSGLIVQGYGSSGETTAGGTASGASGALIRNLHLVGAYVATESAGHGINFRGKVTVRDVRIESFGGDGLYGFGNAGAANGNVNGSRFENVVIFNCRWADWTGGADGNDCNFIGVAAFGNRRGGHNDASFLGNRYVGGDLSSNGVDPAYPTSANYDTRQFKVLPGQEVWCSTNAPPTTATNNQGWAYAGAAGGYAGGVAWVTGLTWFFGAPFTSDNLNSFSVFDSIYLEGNQHAPVVGQRATVRSLINNVPPITPTGALSPYQWVSEWVGRLGGDWRVGKSLTVDSSLQITGANATLGVAGTSGAGNLSLGGGSFYAQTPADGQFICRDGWNGFSYFTADVTGLRMVTGRALYQNDIKVVGAQGAAVADPAAITGAAPAAPAAITSAAGVVAAAAPTKAEFDALVAEFNKDRTDLAAVRTALIATNAELVKTQTDLASERTANVTLLARLRAATGHGLIA